MRKVFNYRFFCFTALCAALAVIPCIYEFSFTWIIALSSLGVVGAIVITRVRVAPRTKWTTFAVLLLFSVLTLTNFLRLNAPSLPTGEGMHLRFCVSEVSVDKLEVSGSFTDLDSGIKYDDAVLAFNYLDFGHELFAGDEVDLVGDVSAIPFRMNNGKFSTYYLKGYRYEIYDAEIFNVSRGAASLDLAEVIRSYMLDRVNDIFEGDNRGVAAALLFGDKTMISEKVKNDMSSSGLSHVLAISGLHFSVIAGLVAFAIDRTKVNIRPKILISTLIMLIYAWICDFSPSVTRSFIMIAVAGLAKWSCRKYDVLSSICFAGTVDLIIRPENLVSLSFLMSYTAVLGIVFLTKRIKHVLRRLPNVIGDFISVSLAANIGIFPIACECFGQTSVIFLLSNALVLPLMGAAYVLLLLCMIPGALGVAIGAVSNIAVGYIIDVGAWTASFPFSAIDVPQMGPILIIAYYAVIIYSSEYIFRKKVDLTPVERLEIKK